MGIRRKAQVFFPKITFIPLLAFFAALSGCKSRDSNSSKDLGLSFSAGPQTKNVFVSFLAPNPANPQWVPNPGPVPIANDAHDIFSGIISLDQSFHAYGDESSSLATFNSWMKTLLDPDHLTDDGTLFLYIAGHGNQGGEALLNSGEFINYKGITDAILKGRNNRPFKRFIFMLFGCYSGSWMTQVKAFDNKKIADEFYFFVSSRADELSYANAGDVNRSYLIQAFKKALAPAIHKPEGITFGSFFDQIVSIVPNMSTQFVSHPLYYVSSPKLLDETLFSQDNIELYKTAEEQGIMPSIEDFQEKWLIPTAKTIKAKRDQTFNIENNCKIDVLKNADGTEICGVWNFADSTARKLYTYTPVSNDGTSKCDVQLITNQMQVDRYQALHKHCDGILRKPATIK